LTSRSIAKVNKIQKTGNTDHKKHSEGKQNTEKQATLTTRSIAKANKTHKKEATLTRSIAKANKAQKNRQH
jgi:hypothetical protein